MKNTPQATSSDPLTVLKEWHEEVRLRIPKSIKCEFHPPSGPEREVTAAAISLEMKPALATIQVYRYSSGRPYAMLSYIEHRDINAEGSIKEHEIRDAAELRAKLTEHVEAFLALLA